MSTVDAAIIKHIANGNDIPSEDVLTRFEGQLGVLGDDQYAVEIPFDQRVFSPGNILRLRNKTNGQIDSFVVVLFGTPSLPQGDNNTILINTSTNEEIMAKIICTGNTSDPCGLVVYKDRPDYKGFDDTKVIDPEVGLFINEQMSYKTLNTVLRYSKYYLIKSQ